MPDRDLTTLSSTETPAVIGVSPWATRWMIMQRFLGNEIPKAGDNRMDWGLRMQPSILEAVADELAIEIEPNALNNYVRRGLLGATIDAWSTAPDQGRGVIEVKCCFDWFQWRDAWGGGKTPPRYVEVQLQHQLYVGDGTDPFQWGMIVCWYAGELHYFRREPIPDLQQMLADEAEGFFRDLSEKNYGEPFGTPQERPLIAKLFAPVPGKVLDLREGGDVAMHLAADVVAFDQFRGERLFAEKNEANFKGRIAAAMKDAEKMLLPQGVVVDAKTITKNMKPQPARTQTYTQLSAYVPDGANVERPLLLGGLAEIIKAG
jgi:YqaJ-like viral recombinase domain